MASKKSLMILLSLLMSVTACKQKNYLQESRTDFDKRMEWWRDAGFGMFIHWGLYAIPAGAYKGQTNHAEWIQETADIPVDEYETFAAQFNPTKFNADEWVSLAKEAGMKYLVITAKHHDGFCLWDSKVSDYDVMDRTPFKRDILKELSEACKKQGIKFCTYYSIMDWHHPDAQGENYPNYNFGTGPNPNFNNYVENYMKPQLKELITNYGPLGVLWFDGEWIAEWSEEQGRELYNYVRNLQPDIIINNRVGKGRQGMQGMNAYQNAAGDFGTPEQKILEQAADMDWESCMTMNDHWGYNQFDHNFKSAQTIVHHLIDIAAKGGNYLLNVGPRPDGTFPQESVEILQEIARWMRVNSPVIHNSRLFQPYREGPGQYLVQDKTEQEIYLVLTEWPGRKVITHYVKPQENARIFLLGFNQPLSWQFDLKNGLQIDLPETLQQPANRPCDYAWAIRIPGQKAPFVGQPVVSTDQKQNVSNELFTESVLVRLASPTPGSVIHYTLDGREPDENAPVYQEPLTLTSSKWLKARAFKNGFIPSYTTTARFRKISDIHHVEFLIPFSKKYSARGKLTLFDGELGGTNYTNDKWLGFEGQDMELLIDLGQSRKLRSVACGFLQNIDAWIFLPQWLTLEVSWDGKNFEQVGLIKNEVEQNKPGAFRKEFEQTLNNVTARFLRIKARNIGVCPAWHKGAGGKAWVFADEIVIN